MNSKRRIGRFFVSSDLLQTIPGELYKLFGYLQFVPVRVHHMWDTNQFEMIGLSPHFREVDQGEVAPLYTLTISDKHGYVIDEQI
mgnify:CR=1 FL=1